MAEGLLGADQESVAVGRFAQRLRRHGAYLFRSEAFEPPCEADQAVEAAHRRRLVEHAPLVEAGAEAHRLLEVVDAPIAAVLQLADLEAKAVRAHVDGSQRLAGPRLVVARGR